jgi:poly(3-hydroxybutyrate) depolymerase
MTSTTESFVVADPVLGKRLPIYLALPDAPLIPTAPILFVMHGTLRNAEEYRNQWLPLVEKHHMVVACPEFSKKDFPGGLYNRGNVCGENDDRPQARERFTFFAIERLFSALTLRLRSEQARYDLYGHSAGGQFVHRHVLFLHEARVRRAVAANAGYYTLPTNGPDPVYPFSLKGAPGVTPWSIRKALEKELIVLLGEADTDPRDPDLYHSPEADAQGQHRFARGQHFYATAKRQSAPLAWRLETVLGVGHSNEKMAPAAAKLLYEN